MLAQEVDRAGQGLLINQESSLVTSEQGIGAGGGFPLQHKLSREALDRF